MWRLKSDVKKIDQSADLWSPGYAHIASASVPNKTRLT